MNRQMQIHYRHVEFIPKDLEEGILYISKRFKTASHLCCCGCGNKVVTPLNPAKWQLVEYKSTVSLSPSIGLGALPCRSHYWIRHSRVYWCPQMTEPQTTCAERADEYASQLYTGERSPIPSSSFNSWTDSIQKDWQRFIRWLLSLFLCY